jgi:hypothetical protein
MSEKYPNDQELLNIQSDSATGIEYIPTGQVPYYLQFRKMLYRLILAFSRANELRVYDAGGLDIGVKPGAFWNGTELVQYEGSIGSTLADDKDNIYIYLNADGELITDNYTAFPDMATSPHIRLAIVKTADGDISSITDCRGGHNFVMPYQAGGIKKLLQAHTSDGELDAVQSGSIHTNGGASATVTLLLPASAPIGTIFDFAVTSSQELRIDPGDYAILDDSSQTAGRYKYANTVGASLSLAADAGHNWVVTAKHGSWSEEA